ncbi:MAG: hypothetical protein PVJ92_01590 [Candidatus Dependentiae bacterium]|jgi:hypothetical protein
MKKLVAIFCIVVFGCSTVAPMEEAEARLRGVQEEDKAICRDLLKGGVTAVVYDDDAIMFMLRLFSCRMQEVKDPVITDLYSRLRELAQNVYNCVLDQVNKGATVDLEAQGYARPGGLLPYEYTGTKSSYYGVSLEYNVVCKSPEELGKHMEKVKSNLLTLEQWLNFSDKFFRSLSSEGRTVVISSVIDPSRALLKEFCDSVPSIAHAILELKTSPYISLKGVLSALERYYRVEESGVGKK